MAVLSGKNGNLYLGGAQVAPVSNWRLAVSSNNPNYAANDTGGWKQRAAGVRDSSGSFEVKVDDSGNCPVAEGDSAALELHIDASGNNYYAVAAIIDTIEVDVDISAGKIVAYIIDFSGNGPVTPHGVAATAS